MSPVRVRSPAPMSSKAPHPAPSGAVGLAATAQTEAPTFEALWQSYRRNLVARRRSPATIAGKDYTARLWSTYRAAQGWLDAPADWQRAEVEQFIAHLLATRKP